MDERTGANAEASTASATFSRCSILLMTIVGMAVVLVQLWRESDAQRQEIGRLRAELGYLSIDNENMVYVKQIDVNEPDTRRFRIYLPKNRKFKLYFRTLTVPGRQPNETGATGSLRC